ncbi:hypothetical protein GCM10022222_48580 [Amycolatopsis ultiminotia]|uniref:Uncharacterized protein n=1 Tax=Amycolatopsis ultiminotia TaxID=543629 RepID=A0ABP6WZS7_9PSEU
MRTERNSSIATAASQPRLRVVKVGSWLVLSCFAAATGPDLTGSSSRGFVVPVVRTHSVQETFQ